MLLSQCVMLCKSPGKYAVVECGAEIQGSRVEMFRFAAHNQLRKAFLIQSKYKGEGMSS